MLAAKRGCKRCRRVRRGQRVAGARIRVGSMAGLTSTGDRSVVIEVTGSSRDDSGGYGSYPITSVMQSEFPMNSAQCRAGMLNRVQRSIRGAAFTMSAIFLSNPTLLAANSFTDSSAFPVSSGLFGQSEAVGALSMLESASALLPITDVAPNEQKPLSFLNSITRRDARPAVVSMPDSVLSVLIRWVNTRPDKERFAGFLDAVHALSRIGTPEFHELVQKLPVTVEQTVGTNATGQPGVWKTYVHRSGKARTVFVPRLTPRGAGARDVHQLETPAPELDAAGADADAALATNSHTAARSVASVDYCEWFEGGEDLSGDCATEQDIDDAFAAIEALTAEMSGYADAVEDDREAQCDEIKYDVEHGGDGWSPEELELCPYNAPLAPAGLELSFSAELMAPTESAYGDSPACVERGCVLDALLTIGSVGFAIAEVDHFAGWVADGLVSNLARFSVRALALKAGIALAAVGLAVGAGYVWWHCRHPY